VISNDTRFNENVIRFGTGTGLLIQEVAAVPELLKDKQVERVMAHHTSPQGVGTVFSRATLRLAPCTHLVLLRRPGIKALAIGELIP